MARNAPAEALERASVHRVVAQSLKVQRRPDGIDSLS